MRWRLPAVAPCACALRFFGGGGKAAPDIRAFGSLSTHGVAAARWAADEAAAAALLAPVADAYDALLATSPDALAPELEPPSPEAALAAGPGLRFRCYAAGTTRAMRWLYAADDATLDLFRPLSVEFADKMAAAVAAGGWAPDGGGALVELSAASFVAISGAAAGIGDDIARWHEDWGPCGDHEAYSVLLPLRAVPRRAKRAHRLEYRPWREGDGVCVYDYALGDAIIVDGRAPHRTKPFTAGDLRAAGGERVLVCLNFASTDPAARDAQLETMRSQTPHFFRLPGGLRADTAGAAGPAAAATGIRAGT